MSIKIALVGNPNSGKTTLFNCLTGSNQYVGNWPGVTVEKKEGKLRNRKDITVVDLPGIYSLSPYTLEEVIARNYLLDEKPDAILNIVDGTNLERNLYLTTQLQEIGIPMVVAVNMLDILQKQGDKLDLNQMKHLLNVPVIEISALKCINTIECSNLVIETISSKHEIPMHTFQGPVEHALAHIEAILLKDIEPIKQRFYAIKIFENDSNIIEKLNISQDDLNKVKQDIELAEKELFDDRESIIISQRYLYISSIINGCFTKKTNVSVSKSDKIDKIITNRYLGLPIFAIIMFIVYYLSMVTVGKASTDWANDGLFKDGWFALGIGRSQYQEKLEPYEEAMSVIDGYGLDIENLEESFNKVEKGSNITALVVDEETLQTEEIDYTYEQLLESVKYLKENQEPNPSDYGLYIDGVENIVSNYLDSIEVSSWLKGLIVDGIIAGVGAVLGFVPQMLVLFLLLSFLEACGYMARIAFVLDRIFRKFGLSGKSFIPMLIGTGCGIPGVMASRTIENENDRKMTVMTTTFIPCSAKVPFIAMIAGALFSGSAFISTGAYFIGMAAIIISGIILKKTFMFKGNTSPFVMELPSYHMPQIKNLLRTTWDKGFSFIKKASTIILLSTIFIWFTSYFGFTDEGFTMLLESELDMSLLAQIGKTISWIFTPLGFGNWKATIASITGLVAKENIVGTMAIVYKKEGEIIYHTIANNFTQISGLSFLIFNLLCAPCFAAMAAIKKEMGNAKWTIFALTYQCGFAYVISLIVYNVANAFMGNIDVISLVVSVILLIAIIYMLFRKNKYEFK